MITKTIICTSNAIHAAKERLTNRDGMELLQTVILIGIALALGGIMMWFLRDFFQGTNNEGFWGMFRNRLSNILNTGNDNS